MEPTTRTSPKDVFMHLLAIIALYISAVSFGALIFQYIDVWFPDPLTDMYMRSSDAIRWALSTLVVVFPVYVWVSLVLAKDALLHKEKRELKTRKWLYHFTLFAAAILIIGDIVALLYRFLGGDLSNRFFLKVAVILFIAGAIFIYYLWNIRKEGMASRDSRMRIFLFFILLIVATSIVSGFFSAGSPFRERMRRFDERRVQDLQNIQWQVVNYWQRKERLPETLDMLRDDISGYSAPRDPENGTSYEYKVAGNLEFLLCANFQTAQTSVDGVDSRVPYSTFSSKQIGLSENWAYAVGKTCFERTIDPELYPAFPEKGRMPVR